MKGDFCQLVRADMEMIDEKMDDENIQSKSKLALKSEVKQKIREAALEYLKNKQKEHSKIKNIEYDKLETQKYMVDPKFANKEVNMLHALRSRSTNVKINFRTKFQNGLLCPLCQKTEDSQPHMLDCSELNKRFKTEEVGMGKIKYEDIFADLSKQKEAAYLYLKLFEIRNQLLDKNLQNLDPSTSTEVLESSDNLHNRIVHYSFGK